MKKNLRLLPLFCLWISLWIVSCEKKAPDAVLRPLPVVIAEAAIRDVPIYVDTFGHLVSPISVELRPQVSGVIDQRYVEEGQDVKKGENLYLIDPKPYQAIVDKAKAVLVTDQINVDFAQKKLNHYAALIKGDFVSKLTIEEYTKDLQAQESQFLTDKAELAIAEIDLNYCKIVSPIDGRVGLAKIDPGNLVVKNDAQAIVRIVQIAPIDVEFALPQRSFERLQPLLNGRPLKLALWLPNTPSDIYEGEIIAFDNAINTMTGTIKMKGRIPNHEKRLWPGAFIYVRLFLEENKRALVIPESAVQVGQKGNYVYLLQEDQHVELIPVKAGEHVDHWVIIEEGIKEGDKVVTDGQLNLLPGSKVVVTEAGEKAP